MFPVNPQRQQNAQPVCFDTIQPLDVEDWVKINISTRCEGYSPQPESLRDTLSAQYTATPDTDESRPPKPSHQVKIDDSPHPQCAIDQPQIASNTAKGSSPQRLLRTQLSNAQKALSKAVETMELLDDRGSEGARLGHLSGVLKLIEQEVEQLVLRGTCDDPRVPTVPELVSMMSSEAIRDKEASIDTVSEVSDSSSNVPGVLSEFFEHARQVNLLREQMWEGVFVEAQPDAIEGREDGDSSDRVQGEGEADESKIMALRAALLVAKDRMAAQWEKCLAEGLDPERLRYRRRSSASA